PASGNKHNLRGCMHQVRFDRAATIQIQGISATERRVVRANVDDIATTPGRGRPSGLNRAKPQVWQHPCPPTPGLPGQFLVLYRWSGGDKRHPPNIVTIEEVFLVYGM